MKRHTIIIIVTVLMAAFASCSYENTATVTIDTGIRTQAHINWFDRVLAFLSLAQPLQADPPEPGLDIVAITVTVTASDMATITQEIPLDTGRITLEVPAGSQRTFEVIAGYSSESRDYGGICTVDLAAGQQVNLDIHMGKLNNYFNYYYYLTGNNYMQTEYEGPDDPISGVIAFKIYQSDDYQYTNEKIKYVITQWTASNSGYWTITIPVVLSDIGTKYYRCSVVNQYGEGEKILITEY